MFHRKDLKGGSFESYTIGLQMTHLVDSSIGPTA